MKRTNARSNALPIIAAPLKYSDAAMWFSGLWQLNFDNGMEIMECFLPETGTGWPDASPSLPQMELS